MHIRENQSESKKQFDKIICEIRKNSEEGLHQFHEAYSRFIFLTAKNICKTDDIANAVVNEVLLKIDRAVKDNKKIEKPITWISVITKNCALDSIKGKQYVELNEDILADKNPIDALIDEISFYEKIEHLMDDEKAIVTKKIVGGFTFKDIGDEDNLPTSTISSIYYRALKKVRNKLEKYKEVE